MDTELTVPSTTNEKELVVYKSLENKKRKKG